MLTEITKNKWGNMRNINKGDNTTLAKEHKNT